MPYDVGVALRRFKNLIRWAANHYAKPGHFRRSKEELEAEGLLILVQCCRDFPDGEMFFARYFKRSLYNRLRDLSRFDRTWSRDGFEVELTEAANVSQKQVVDPFLEIVSEKAEHLYPLLNREARRFLRALIDPPTPVCQFAWMEFCRRNKLVSQGQKVRDAKRFRIKLRHIRQYLGMNTSDVRRIVEEIKTAIEGGQ
jgi:hypothetical protein